MKSQKRTYKSESRNAQAAKTHSRILKTAKRLFEKQGFDPVTISLLAQEAGVSMPTIYALFKSKRGVLQSLIDEALPPRQFEGLVEQAMQASDPKKRFKITAKIARQMYDAERELMDILRGASVVAPEFKELEQEREARRYQRQGDSVKEMIRQGTLAKGLSEKKARDIIWTLTGRDIYRLCVVERGWSSDEYEDWLANLLVKALH